MHIGYMKGREMLNGKRLLKPEEIVSCRDVVQRPEVDSSVPIFPWLVTLTRGTSKHSPALGVPIWQIHTSSKARIFFISSPKTRTMGAFTYAQSRVNPAPTGGAASRSRRKNENLGI